MIASALFLSSCTDDTHQTPLLFVSDALGDPVFVLHVLVGDAGVKKTILCEGVWVEGQYHGNVRRT